MKDLRPQKISNKLTSKSQRTANQYAAKRRIYKRPDQQKYTLSRHTEFCKADRTTWKLTFRDKPQKGRNSCLRLRPRSVFGSFGVVLMTCEVNFHVVRSGKRKLYVFGKTETFELEFPYSSSLAYAGPFFMSGYLEECLMFAFA